MDKYPQLPPENTAAELFGARVWNSPLRVGDLLVSRCQILVATLPMALGFGFYLRDGHWEWKSFHGLSARAGDRVFR